MSDCKCLKFTDGSISGIKLCNFHLQIESALAASQARAERFREALESISKNSCCAPCREAGLFAKSALDSAKKEGGV